ncbi:hypothetical protein [Methanogenium organophilum]|uniref:Uncharacterized protein n=1 Tax=Methanogenium organophilum TaxID=2199 RepID=A0A9X9S691_METOG|nr:hypothetical protein [Methanogenium organophilum]WAI02188.1 hypothetical protein OU421_04765 [Methanogenium organophilum]
MATRLLSIWLSIQSISEPPIGIQISEDAARPGMIANEQKEISKKIKDIFPDRFINNYSGKKIGIPS